MAAFTAGSAAVPARQAVAQEESSGDAAWRERVVSEFAAALTKGKAPPDTCLSVHRNGEALLSVKAGRPLIPASITKIATSAVALKLMGPDATYTTEVVVGSAELAAVRSGVLTGDVYLVGGGDPVLSTRGYIGRSGQPRTYTDVSRLADTVMASLRAAGITRIEGSIVGDGSWYRDAERDYTAHRLPGESRPVWKRSYVTSNLVGPLSGLMINDGYARYSSSRQGHVRATDPPQAAASLFDDLLEARGMVITKRPRSGLAPAAADRTGLGRIQSPPLSEILSRVLAWSDNTTAEMLLKEIGRRTSGSERAEAAAGAAFVLAGMLGDAAEGVVIVDGSGLSVHNRLTCRAAAVLLAGAGAHSALYAGLGVAGKTGTLRGCTPQAPPAGQGPPNTVMVKSGSLNDSRGLAGATLTASGELVTFAMIANEPLIIARPFCPTLQRQLLTAAAQYTYGPTPPLQDRPPLFSDVTGGVHRANVEAAAAAGITWRCGRSGMRFCPRAEVSRGHFALMVSRAMGLEPSAEETAGARQAFGDVTSDVFAAGVAGVISAGVMSQCSASPRLFCFDSGVSRAEAAAVLARALKLAPSPDPPRFSDVDGLADAAAIEAIAAAGITSGCNSDGTRFCPERIVTRAQAATLLARAFKLGIHANP